MSRKAGIHQNPIGFGLNVSASDFNKDGWPDLYVTNDFMERDYMYINQGDGSFRDEIQSRTNVISYSSMGSDVADINNDGSLDILTLGMLPYDYFRRKVFKEPNYSIYSQLIAQGYHRQNMRNMLQINNGEGVFTEVGRLAGITKTDWSWLPLIADFDKDGKKDIYVTNGFPRFYTNLDFLNEELWERYPDLNFPDDPENLYNLVLKMSKVKLHNFAFKNTGNLSFEDASTKWGLGGKVVSNGAAYADLNNNGSLDLIVNNINKNAFVYRNNSNRLNNNKYLKIKLRSSGKNTYGFGTKVRVFGDNGVNYFKQVFPVRGFQSSVSPDLFFGLDSLNDVNVKVTWPDQSQELLKDISTNQTITLRQDSAKIYRKNSFSTDSQDKLFLLLDNQALGLNYKHQGSFNQDRVIPL